MIKTKEIYILGVGNNTSVYIDLVESCGYLPIGLFHYNNDRTGGELLGVPIIDCNDNLLKQDLTGKNFALSMGDNKLRASLALQIRSKGGIIPTLIHPTAVVSKYAIISESVVIHANAVIQAGASIGQNCVISYNASITHTSTISKNCYLAAYAHIGAYTNVQENVLIGQGAITISGKVDYIGQNVIIGAGSVVTKNIEANCIVAGSPARVIKKTK